MLGAVIIAIQKIKASAVRHKLWLAIVMLLFSLLFLITPWPNSIYNSIFSEPEASKEGALEEGLKLAKKAPKELNTLFLPDLSKIGGTYIVRSSGYGAGESFVQKDGSRISFKRGLTLVGLSDDREPVKLSYVDSCGGSLIDKDALDHSEDFTTVIKKHSGSFGAFVIVGHDSVVCHKKEYFNITAPEAMLDGLNGISLRQPYIAVIPAIGSPREFFGKSGESIGLKVTGFTGLQKESKQRASSSIERIAHAGGGYDGKTYTNSIDALDDNKTKFSLFEIDLSWTSDGELVCLHDWEASFERSFKTKAEQPVSYAKFVELVSEKSDLEKCTLATLVAWLERNPNKRIVTDIKEKNTAALTLIAKKHPRLKHRFVPQVYQPDEYYVAKSLGFNDVIWTLYRFRGNHDSVLKHLQDMDLYGLTMPRYKADAGLAQLAFKETGVLSYVHTINSKSDYAKYLELGVSEIYTDWID